MTAALEVTRLCKSFGGIAVTQDVSLTVQPGERRLIIGPNGAGKTTLFNQIAGEIACDSGTVRVFGEDVTRLPVRARAHVGVSRTYQVITLFARDTLLHNVVLGLLGVDRRRFEWLRPLAGLHRERHVLRHGDAAETLAQGAHFQCGGHGLSRRSRRIRPAKPEVRPAGMKTTMNRNTSPSRMFQRSM